MNKLARKLRRLWDKFLSWLWWSEFKKVIGGGHKTNKRGRAMDILAKLMAIWVAIKFWLRDYPVWLKLR